MGRCRDVVDRGTTPCFSTPLSNPDNKVPLNLAYHRANIRFAVPSRHLDISLGGGGGGQASMLIVLPAPLEKDIAEQKSLLPQPLRAINSPLRVVHAINALGRSAPLFLS